MLRHSLFKLFFKGWRVRTKDSGQFEGQHAFIIGGGRMRNVFQTS